MDTKWYHYSERNGGGNGLDQFSSLWGIYIDDDDETIYVADYGNYRVVERKKGATTGQVVAEGNGIRNRNYQLNRPRNVIIDQDSDSLVISDRENKRVVRWPRQNYTSGETIISNVVCFGLAIDNNGYLYVSEVTGGNGSVRLN